MTYQVMSADCHLDITYLPADCFLARMDSTWGDEIPHVVASNGKNVWMSGDNAIGPWAYYGPGVAGGKRGRILVEEGFAAGDQLRPSNPTQRWEDMQRDGVDAEVIYGIIAISKGRNMKSGIEDRDLLAAVYHAYNKFIAEFNQQQPGRFYGLGCIPNHDVKAAANEVEHCAKLGLPGVLFVPWGAAMPVWHNMWEPMWTAAEQANLAFSFHVFEGGGATVGYDVNGISHPASIGAWTVVAPLQMDEICASIILSGVCERHPSLRFVLGEAGIGWIPYMLERIDDTYAERLADDLRLDMAPSEYFKRQIYSTFQKDFHGLKAMAEIAPDNIMWGSDYPHRDGTWPNSQAAIADQFCEVSPGIAQKALWSNARRVYGIDS